MRTPVVIGGATTSDMHTAVKIAPAYSGPVVRSENASRNNAILARLLGPDRDRYVAEVREAQEALREEYRRTEQVRRLVPVVEVRREKRRPAAPAPRPAHTGRLVFPDFDAADVVPLIDWNFFFPAWGLKGRWPELLDHPEKGLSLIHI